MNIVLIWSNLLAIAIKKIHVMVVAFVYFEHKQISLKQINQEIILVDFSLSL